MVRVPMASRFNSSPGPCKDCLDRCVGCHSSCEGYIKWKRECDKARQDYVDSLKSERLIEDYSIKKAHKNKGMKPMW